MSTPESSPSPAPVGAIAALVFATLFYIGMVACLSDLHHPGQDAAGRGLAAGFAAIFGFLVWAFLGLLLLIAGIKGSMPFWAGIAVVILLPLSAIAAGIALDLTERGDAWLLIVPVALPPAFAAYGLWARLTGLHRALPETATSAAAVAVLTLLTLAPMPQYIARERDRAAVRVEQRAEEKAQDDAADRRHAEALARFQKLTADSPLSDWAVFFGNDSEFDRQAIDGARKLPHRQSDAVEALRRGAGFPLAEYSRLDLAATPEFCTAARDFLLQAAATHQAAADDPGPQEYFAAYIGAIEVLTKENCDLGAAVAAIDAAVAPASPRTDGFRGMLAWRYANGFKAREDYGRAIDLYSTAIRFSPGYDQFWVSRGDAYLDKLDYARAIPDYTEGIRLNPGYSAAYNARGYAYHAMGDDDHALPDFDQAIQLNGGLLRAFFNRGSIYSARGDQTRAIADYDSALSLSPKFWEALAGRGRARYYRGEYPQAAADLGAALPLSTSDTAYTVLWLYLARARSGQDARGALPRDAAAVDRAAWPWPVLAGYLGQTEPGAVLAASHGDTGHECEAEFYFGAKAAAEGDAATARDLLQRAVSACTPDFIEAPAARFEVARLPP